MKSQVSLDKHTTRPDCSAAGYYPCKHQLLWTCGVQELPMTFGTVGVQVKLNALMQLASLQDIILRCQDVEAVLDYVRQNSM